MGFWGAVKKVGRAISSGVAAAGKFIKKNVEKKIEKLKKVSKKVKSNVSNMWNKYSGKDKYDEAKELLATIEQKFYSKKNEFEEESTILFNTIENKVKDINKYKNQILQELLPDMVELLSKMKDVEIPQEFTADEFIRYNMEMEEVRKKSELFRIDFDKHKVKTAFQALLMLGIFTRKKAKETLIAVKEEELKINDQILRMEIELKKLKGVDTALENAVYYFENLVRIYNRLLGRVDHSINILYVKSMLFTHSLVSKNLSIHMLNKTGQKDIQALITASKLLKKMGETKFAGLEETSIKKFERDAKMSDKQMNDILKAA